jgi:YD repeat-containing protein
VCYGYDLARNLETKRVEGLTSSAVCTSALSSPPAPTTANPVRTTQTQWHSYWRLPIKVAEPNKRTTYIYNGDSYNGNVVTCAPVGATVLNITGGTRPIGVLCRQIEESTTDATGSQGFSATVAGTPRISNWTYDTYGQVLTADGPRTDITDTTTYTYHPANDPVLGKRGNLATVTNPLGHVTQIPDYDANGRPLTIIDANNVTTTLLYDLRGRLTSKTVGGEVTNYQYDAVGQLTKVTLPDSSYINYTYDAAHRLTDIADNLGNTIHYTLDAMGNRTQEDIKDPQGTLSQQTTRVYDALNRLQTLTGAQ